MFGMTSCTRRTCAPRSRSSEVMATVALTASPPPLIFPRNDLRETPTTSGRFSIRRRGRLASSSRLCATVLPNPIPGSNGFQEAEIPERVRRLERVVVVLAVIVDPAHARAQHEILVRQDLVPERLHVLHLREESVAPDVEPPPVALDRPADATDNGVGLENRGPDAVSLREDVRGGQPRGAGANDDHMRWRVRAAFGKRAHHTRPRPICLRYSRSQAAGIDSRGE